MRVLGLDPGSRRTGFGVVERRGGRLACVEQGTIAPPERLDLAGRLCHIAREAGLVMDRARPAVVVVEEAFYHRNVRSTLVLGHVRGALLVAAAERGIAVAEYSPRSIKLAVTGTGAAQKEQVAYMVRRLLELRIPLAPDAADALAGAVCHLNQPSVRVAALAPGARTRRGPTLADLAALAPRRRTPAADRLAAMLATVPSRGARRSGGAR